MILADAKAECSGLLLRTISALVLAPLTLVAIVFGNIPFLILIIAAFLISVREWRSMTVHTRNPFLHMIAGSLYLACCFLSFYLLRMDVPAGILWTVGLIVTVWASDSGAYFSGKIIGGPKLAPMISPKKTWAGFAGSVFFGGLTLFLFFLVFFTGDSPLWTSEGEESLNPFPYFIAGAIVGAVGQAGDLLVSVFKRRSGLKDTGNLIPGHGGLLDRIDSLLLAAPVFLAIVWVWLA